MPISTYRILAMESRAMKLGYEFCYRPSGCGKPALYWVNGRLMKGAKAVEKWLDEQEACDE